MAKVTPQPSECGGVLVPDGAGYRRTCFIEERGHRVDGSPFKVWDLQLTLDHYIPKSVAWAEFGLDGWAASVTHLAHRYCQTVQGGMFRGKLVGPLQGYRNARSGHTARIASLGGFGMQATRTAEQRRAQGLFFAGTQTHEQLSVNGRKGGGKNTWGRWAMHVRWHVNREVTKPGCSYCEEGSKQ